MLYFVQHNCKATDGPFHEATRTEPFYEATQKHMMDYFIMKQPGTAQDGPFHEAARPETQRIDHLMKQTGNAKYVVFYGAEMKRKKYGSFYEEARNSNGWTIL